MHEKQQRRVVLWQERSVAPVPPNCMAQWAFGGTQELKNGYLVVKDSIHQGLRIEMDRGIARRNAPRWTSLMSFVG